VHRVGFHYKNISRCTVLWMSNSLHWLHYTRCSIFPQKYVISNEKYFIWNMTCRTANLVENAASCHTHSFISIQPSRPGLAGTRAQSCDRYGSGTLHPGQLLGGSLPLFSPAFRRSHFSRQVPPSTMTREILAAKGGTVGEKDYR